MNRACWTNDDLLYEDNQRKVKCVWFDDGSIGLEMVNKFEIPPTTTRLVLSRTAAVQAVRLVKQAMRFADGGGAVWKPVDPSQFAASNGGKE